MPEPARISVSDAEIDAALERARKWAGCDQRVTRAAYAKGPDRLRLAFDNGVTVSIPRRVIQGLAEADEKELSRIQILSDGTGLLWPLLGVSHYVPNLLQGIYGSERWIANLNRQKRKLKLIGPTGNSRAK